MNNRLIDVGIIMGSDSDVPIATGAREVLEQFGVPFAATIRSAHRTPDDVPVIVKEWAERGCKVYVAAAGAAAHLGGVIASQTCKPVIAIPLTTKSPSAVNGLDALLSSVQMPTGIPVATVAINGAANAAYLAIAILAVSNPELEKKLKEHRDQLVKKTMDKAEKLKISGWPN